MPFPSDHFYDVLIAGAGPVGLSLACELRLGGCSVLVLEAAPTPASPLKRPPFGLRGLTVPTIEALDRRGLLEAIRERAGDARTPGTTHWTRQLRRPAGHFAGIPFFEDRIDASQSSSRKPSQLAIDMASLEAVLTARAEALGVRIRRDCRVEDIEKSEDAAVVRVGDELFVGHWLVACDGGRSAVRKAAGIGFAGTDPEFTGYSVEVELADPGMLSPGRHYTPTGMYLFEPPGTIAMADFDGGVSHRAVPVTREHVEAVLQRIVGTNVQVRSIGVVATWTDRAFQATRYRKGRVLLAGDAAHVHSPLGGQGLNLGLGDATNLGWKLAAVIRKRAPDGLLDTYERERHPVGAKVLDWSRAQVALMRPNPSSRALAAIVRDLIGTRDGSTYFADRVRGLDMRYDLGGEHPLVGRSAPDVVLADGTRLNERLRSGKGVLVEFGGAFGPASFAERWTDRLAYAQAEVRTLSDAAAFLVRPDGIVAWAGRDPVDREGIECAALRWFKTPSASDGEPSGMRSEPAKT